MVRDSKTFISDPRTGDPTTNCDVTIHGSIEGPKGPVGFSAAVIPFLSATGEKNLENQQDARLRSQFDSKTGLYGTPAKYYDQNLALFAVGFIERRFWFNSQGALQLSWKHS
jgi:endo-1,4-beta-D-glucanase Y